MKDAYEVINHTLVSLINEIWELEEKAIITEEFKDLTNNDMHVIEAIGLGNGGNMSAIAKKLNITMGSLTTAMNSLVNKKYVERHRSEEDRRVVFVRLTAKGLYGVTNTKTLRDIRVYGNPTLTYDLDKDYFSLSDTLNALMAIPNCLALILLSPCVIKLTQKYLQKTGKY